MNPISFNLYPAIKIHSNTTKPLSYKYTTQPQFDIFFKAKNNEKEYLDYPFIKKTDAVFFNNIVNTYQNITRKSILNKLEKISSMDRLEGHNKLNLVEHVITKETRGETRNFDKLISNIKYFSENKNLNSVLIADSSKYILEEPHVDMKAFNEVLTYIVNNAKFKDAASIMKISKLIQSMPEKKNMLLYLAKDSFSSPQIKCIASLSDTMTEKLMSANDIKNLDTNTKFEYFKIINNSNIKVFDEKIKKLFPTFPSSKEEAEQLKLNLKTQFSQESPLVIDNLNSLKKDQIPLQFNKADTLVLNICASILKNNKPSKNINTKTFYEQKAFQSIYELEKYKLTYEQQNKICKIINASGKILDKNEEFSSSDIALNLRYRNTFDIFNILHTQMLHTGVIKKLRLIRKDVEKLKNNTNIIPQDSFDDEKFTTRKFSDGTTNKIVEYNIKNKNNPKVMLHSAGIEVAGLIPVEKNADKITMLFNANSNKIFSTSFLNSNDFKPFRTYGFVLNSDYEDILGGSKFDLASGFDKNIENFGTQCLENNSEILSYFPDLIKKRYNLSDDSYKKLCDSAINNNKKSTALLKYCEDLIGSTERIDGRKYNEFFLCNPVINGIFVYGNIESLPFEFRKFAQENDLKIIHIKTREKCKKNIAF